MRGLRNLGQESVANYARRVVPITFLCALVPLLAGCLPEEERQAGDDAAEKIVSFQSTSEQVQRARKADFLKPAGSELADVRPQTMGRPAPARPPAERAAPRTPQRPRNYFLAGFHGALRGLDTGLRHKPVTILHLGDSHIAADRFTGDLRELFQDRFGDAGRGLMMPGFPFAYYRARGVRFAKHGAWAAANSLRKAQGLYGLTGVRLTTRQKNARLSLTSQTGPFEWVEVAFLAGPRQGSAVVAVDGQGKLAKTAADTDGIHRVRIEQKGRTLSVRANGDGPVTVLSWAIGHNRPGVRYVNLGIPGATADTTRRWDPELVSKDVVNLDPDLIVLGFGTNEGFNDRLDIAAYEKRVGALAARLKRAAPDASLAIIGPADGARFPRFAKGSKSAACRPLDAGEKRDYGRLLRARSARLARWHAPPKLSKVRGALKRVAQRVNAHFWDWSAMMGGPCSIHEWSRSQPKLALSDHVHISAEGGRRSAQAFFKSLMTGFDGSGKLASRSDGAFRSANVSR